MVTPDQGSFGKFVPLDTRPFSSFNVVSVQSLREGGTDFIPPLADCLNRWRNGDSNGLLSRAVMLGQAQISTLAITMMVEVLEDKQAPHLFLTHSPTDNPAEKAAELERYSAQIAATLGSTEPLRPVRTVTLGLRTEPALTPVMVTTLGVSVSKETRRAIADDLNASSAAAKNATINPELLRWDPALFLAIMPGLVGPFIEPVMKGSVVAWYYIQDGVSETAPVEIAVSFTDSLIMQREAFEEILKEYDQAFLGGNFYRRISPIV